VPDVVVEVLIIEHFVVFIVNLFAVGLLFLLLSVDVFFLNASSLCLFLVLNFPCLVLFLLLFLALADVFVPQDLACTKTLLDLCQTESHARTKLL